jgi:hypothetical protein
MSLDWVLCGVPRGQVNGRQAARQALHLVVAEEGVLAAAGAVGAAHTAHEEDRHAHRH